MSTARAIVKLTEPEQDDMFRRLDAAADRDGRASA